ncbi:DUF6134 family protein [Bernardetia sp.]|uniref:DUF6134 family protein n=1 Tax=Bernardetia sp. TaxID=1937974 RepID=UPI0025C22581|nr:DUF6134 family protein [Bernardetia sp.]
MIWYICIVGFLFGMLNSSTEKSLAYDIVWRKSPVGTLKVTKEHIDSKTYYTSSTNIEMKFIKTFKINYEYDVVYDNQILQTANVDINYNGNQHAQTQTQLKNGEYEVVKDGEVENTFKATVRYSTISMYFEEPLKLTRCYSEQEGGFNKIIPLGEHKYKKINARGKESIFTYKNGILEKAEIDGGIVSFDMVRKYN